VNGDVLMLYCPKCGSANRRGSRFCNECGEKLPLHTGLRCPMCGAMNPVQNAYCDQCNARIVPMTAPDEEKEPERERPPIRGLSLPTISLDEQPSTTPPQEPEAKEAAGNWLSRLRDSAAEDETETPATEEKKEGTEDWLGELRESAETVEEGEDWLTQLRGSTEAVKDIPAPEPKVTAEPVEPAEIPDWLRGLGPVGVEEQQSSAEQEPTSPESTVQGATAQEPTLETLAPAEVPDWLQDLAPEEAAPPQPAAGEPAAQGAVQEPETPAPAEVPDWLQDLAPEEAAPPQPATGEPEAQGVAAQGAIQEPETPAPAEVPDWLQDLAPEEAAAPQPASAEPAAQEPETPTLTEAPDWLQDIAPEEAVPQAASVEPAAQGAAAQESETPAPAEVPDWLQNLAPEEAAPLQPAVGEPAAQGAAAQEMEMPIPAEVPDWLQKAAPSSMPPPTPPFIGEPPAAEAEEPEWLDDLKQPPTSPTLAVEPDTAAAEAAGLARAEIPAWLEAMRPTAEVAEETAKEEPEETEGILKGLRGVLAPLPMIDVASAGESAPPAEIGQATLARAQLLQSLLTRPTETAQPKARRRTAGMSEAVPRLLITTLLLVVVGGLLIISQDPVLDGQLPRLTQSDTSSIESAYNLIASVGEKESVLVAIEYGPSNADEMNAVARALLSHLAERKATISIVTTQPEGLAVAEVLRSEINAQEEVVSEQQPALEYAKESPGYRPGNVTGVSHILASTNTRPAIIVVLTAQPESLRWWIEQTRVHYGTAPPIVAGVSAVLEIVSSPYLDASADQLQGIVSGLGGAIAYEAQRGAAGQTTRQLDALAAGHLVVVVSMLAGAAFYIIGGSRGRER
jgi:hypothetical protein